MSVRLNLKPRSSVYLVDRENGAAAGFSDFSHAYKKRAAQDGRVN